MMKFKNITFLTLSFLSIPCTYAGKDYNKEWETRMTSLKGLLTHWIYDDQFLGERISDGNPKDLEQFKVTGQCKNCNLNFFDLRDTIKQLKDAGKTIDLEGSNLHGANLSNTNLENANLNSIRAAYANFNQVNFSNASLNKALLLNCQAYKAIFDYIKAHDAQFKFNNFKKASFLNTQLLRTVFFENNFTKVQANGVLYHELSHIKKKQNL